jgi:hypothetical protein
VLQGLSINNRVQLFWVLGNCSIIRNEKADALAGLGSKSNFCGPEPYLLVPKSLMTRVTKKWLSGNHLSYWNLVSGCRQSKVWIKRPCLNLARFLRNLQRMKLGVLIDLLTGNVRSNMCCWISLQKFSVHNRVKLFGMPGHCDIKKNEVWTSVNPSPTFLYQIQLCDTGQSD